MVLKLDQKSFLPNDWDSICKPTKESPNPSKQLSLKEKTKKKKSNKSQKESRKKNR